MVEVGRGGSAPPLIVWVFLSIEVDVTDATKTAEAFLKIASVYKEEKDDVKDAVLDSIGRSVGFFGQ